MNDESGGVNRLFLRLLNVYRGGGGRWGRDGATPSALGHDRKNTRSVARHTSHGSSPRSYLLLAKDLSNFPFDS